MNLWPNSELMRVSSEFRNFLHEVKSRRYSISLAFITSAILLIFVSPATVYLPASFTYLGPVKWDSRIDNEKVILYVTGERQNNNELVIQGSIASNDLLAAPTVIANFASRESGLQLWLEANPDGSSNSLYLLVRDDLPIDVLGDCPSCGVATRPIYIGELDQESNSHNLLIHIRNTPPVIHVEFDQEAVATPSEIYPENIDLSTSQLWVGNRAFVERSEAVSVNDFRVSFSSDKKKIEVKNLALLLMLSGFILGVVTYSRSSSGRQLHASKMSK